MNQIIKFISHQFKGIAGRSNVQHRTLNEKKADVVKISMGTDAVHAAGMVGVELK
jgi:hypothetical protein